MLSASVEAEIARLEATEQAAFLEELGLHESAVARFIRAAYALLDLTFMKLGSEHAVKEAGLLQIEGKDYVVADGDIMHIRFNV